MPRRPRAAVFPWLLALGLAWGSAACAREPRSPPSPPPRAPSPSPPPSAEAVLAEARTGRLGATHRRALLHADPPTRRRAVRLLSWLGLSEARPALLRALSDPDAEVRAEAGFVLSLRTDLGDEPEERLLAALAAEPPTPTRAAHLRSLGRVATERGIAVLRVALGDGPPEERRAACRALADVGSRGEPVDVAVHEALASLLVPETDAAIRREAASALARLPPAPLGETARSLRQALMAGTRDPDPHVRAACFVAFAKIGGIPAEALDAGLGDAEPLVVAEALRALVPPIDSTRDDLLARHLGSAVPSPEHALPAELGRAALLLELGAPLAGQPATFAAAEALHARLGSLAAPGPALGRLHCLAAELVDRGRRWPSRLETCGLGQVPDELRRERIAAVLGDLRGEDLLRLAWLARLFDSGAPRVAAAALRALPDLGVEGAAALLERGLRHPDPGVFVPALQVYALRRERAAPEAAWIPSVDAAAIECLATALTSDLPEAELAGTKAAAVSGIPMASTFLERFARSASRGIRSAALEALARRGRPSPAPTALALPPDPAAPRPLEAPTVDIIFDTDAGSFTLRLEAAAAPLATARIRDAVARGLFDGRRVDRFVPGRLVALGGPRPDAFGIDPPRAPTEPSPEPIERGAVLLSEIGWDTGSTRLLLVASDAPELDGRITRLGRIVDGLELLERLPEQTRIRTARAVPSRPSR